MPGTVDRDAALPDELTRSRAPARRIRADWVSSHPRADRARRVAGLLRQRIAAGGFPDGVVDERALAEELGASRNAVREALGVLRDEGLITRRRGVGTRVVAPTYGHGLDRLAGLAEALAGHGTVTNEVLAAHTVAEPPASVVAALDLKPGVDAVLIQRVRRLDGVPVSLDTTYLTPDIGRSVLQGDLEARDVFVMIEQAVGCRLGRADVEVRAATADPETAVLLDLRAGDPIFAIDRLTSLSDGTPVDVELLQIRGDRMTLHATLFRGPATAG